MIYSDLKPYTDSWKSNLVEVCFTCKMIQEEFSALLNHHAPSGKLKVIEHSEDKDNLYTSIELLDENSVEYVKEVMSRICDKYACDVLDY